MEGGFRGLLERGPLMMGLEGEERLGTFVHFPTIDACRTFQQVASGHGFDVGHECCSGKGVLILNPTVADLNMVAAPFQGAPPQPPTELGNRAELP